MLEALDGARQRPSLAEVRAAMQRHLQPARMATVIVGGQP